MASRNPRLQVDFCGIPFASPLVLLSGCVGFGEEYTRIQGFSNQDCGAVCLKGTTGSARLGNQPHRIYETPGGMLNAIGLQNPGVDAVIDEILPKLVGTYLKSGESLQARVKARLAREEFPDESSTWLASAKVYEAEFRLDEALTAYKKAYDLAPETPGLRLKLGNMYMKQGQAAEGRKYLAEAIDLPDTPRASADESGFEPPAGGLETVPSS